MPKQQAERELRCRICYRRFRSPRAVKEHHDQEHTPPRRCQLCGKQLRDNEYHRCLPRRTTWRNSDDFARAEELQPRGAARWPGTFASRTQHLIEPPAEVFQGDARGVADSVEFQRI